MHPIARQGRLLAAAAAFLLLAGCEWENWVKTEKATPEYMTAPDSAAQLVDYVSRAGKAGLRVRMTGSGHSASDVAITNDVLFTPEKLNKALTLDRTRLKNAADDSLVRVMSGMRIADVNALLDSRGRALANMGGYDGQTIAGVMMTATHGSGLDYGPLADQVVSLQMVVDGGRMVQVEPRNGITNPATWRGTLEENSGIRVELIQDDNAFNAARVAIGSMGIVYSVTLRTDRKFWLREVRYKMPWSEVKKPGGILERVIARRPVYDDRPSPEHVEFQYTPYANADGDHTFLVTERYRSYTALPAQPSTERGQPGTDYVTGLITFFEQPLTWIINTFPAMSKPILEQTLSSQVDDNYTNVSYKVFNIGVANYTEAIAVEAAFDITDTVAAIERSFEIADAQFAQGRVHTGPIAVRFVKATDQFLAMQQGRDTMFIEVIMLKGTNGYLELLDNYQRTFVAEFGARPHWGLDLKTLRGQAQVRALYPKLDSWITWQRRFNPNGTFDGHVTDRLGLSVRPR